RPSNPDSPEQKLINLATMPVNVAVVGFGMSATVFHIPFILAHPDQFSLKTIVERSATPTSSKARDAFPGVKVVNTLEEALDDRDVDAVWILTINDTHFDYVKQALSHGKHVVVEKPITPTSDEAQELANLARDKNLVLAVYQNRRWDADFLTIKHLMSQGAFGEMSEFQSNFDRYRNEAAQTKQWKEKALPGSGLAYDLGSHLVDQILDLFGAPQRVTGFVQNSRLIGNPDVPDQFLIHLHYDPQPSTAGRSLPLIATARGSSLSLVSPQLRFTVKGTKASYVKHGLDVQEDQLKKGGQDAVRDQGFGKESSEASGVLYRLEKPSQPERIVSQQGRYAEWFANVADAISSNDRSRLIVTPEQAALTIKIIELATQSSKEGRTIDL
ncbi:hypothetical protein JCM10212_003558, partial [Sporobolomyces blumeae]